MSKEEVVGTVELSDVEVNNESVNIESEETESTDDFEVIEPTTNSAFVSTWENAIPDEWCDKVVEFFDENEADHTNTVHPDYRQFTELNLFDNELVDGKDPTTQPSKLSYDFMSMIYDYIESYRRFYNISFFPRNAACEEIRIKKYSTEKEDFFNYHVDVGDHPSARRFLVIFLYLNDVEEGGETIFPEYGINIKPKKGTIAIFPPFWTHPHVGDVPKSNDKYIIGTYMHYLDGTLEEVDTTDEEE